MFTRACAREPGPHRTTPASILLSKSAPVGDGSAPKLQLLVGSALASQVGSPCVPRSSGRYDRASLVPLVSGLLLVPGALGADGEIVLRPLVGELLALGILLRFPVAGLLDLFGMSALL